MKRLAWRWQQRSCDWLLAPVCSASRPSLCCSVLPKNTRIWQSNVRAIVQNGSKTGLLGPIFTVSILVLKRLAEHVGHSPFRRRRTEPPLVHFHLGAPVAPKHIQLQFQGGDQSQSCSAKCKESSQQWRHKQANSFFLLKNK